jgi:hypothetical protein
MSARSYCLVTVQDAVEFVSTLAVSEEDAESLLAVDTLFHRAAGWRVVEGKRVVIARRGKVVRLVNARPLASVVSGRSENRAVA